MRLFILPYRCRFAPRCGALASPMSRAHHRSATCDRWRIVYLVIYHRGGVVFFVSREFLSTPLFDTFNRTTADKDFRSAAMDETNSFTTKETNEFAKRLAGRKITLALPPAINTRAQSNTISNPTEDIISMAMLCPRGARPLHSAG
jgi:hypothetical protein